MLLVPGWIAALYTGDPALKRQVDDQVQTNSAFFDQDDFQS